MALRRLSSDSLIDIWLGLASNPPLAAVSFPLRCPSAPCLGMLACRSGPIFDRAAISLVFPLFSCRGHLVWLFGLALVRFCLFPFSHWEIGFIVLILSVYLSILFPSPCRLESSSWFCLFVCLFLVLFSCPLPSLVLSLDGFHPAISPSHHCCDPG